MSLKHRVERLERVSTAALNAALEREMRRVCGDEQTDALNGMSADEARHPDYGLNSNVMVFARSSSSTTPS
jgi:hypothetical protein